MKKLNPLEPTEISSLNITVTFLPGTGHPQEKGSYPRLSLDGPVEAFDTDQKFGRIVDAVETLLPNGYSYSYHHGNEELLEGIQLPVYKGRVRYNILLKRR